MDKIKPMTQVQGHVAICSEVKVFVTELNPQDSQDKNGFPQVVL